jgi:hypothetical protein
MRRTSKKCSTSNITRANFLRSKSLGRYVSTVVRGNELLVEQRYLTDWYNGSRGLFKGQAAAAVDRPTVLIGVVAKWNCKAVWVDVDIIVGGKKTGECRRFHRPSLLRPLVPTASSF